MKKNTTSPLAWIKFQNKINQFNKLPVAQWTEYQFLGYVISKTNLDLTPVVPREQPEGYKQFVKNTSPSRHPHLKNLRDLIAYLHEKPKNRMPNPDAWDRNKVKTYIDWCIKNQRGPLLNFKYWNNEYMFARFCKSFRQEIKLERTTELPEEMRFINDNISTYGHLAFAYQIPEFDMIPYIELGFDPHLLQDIQ